MQNKLSKAELCIKAGAGVWEPGKGQVVFNLFAFSPFRLWADGY
jgi:hypothetical protein